MVSDSQTFNPDNYASYVYRTEVPSGNTGSWSLSPELSVPAEPESRKLGMVQVSFELLKELLGIDKCHKIIKVSELHIDNGVFTILVESENLEEVAEGAIAPPVSIEKVNGYDE